MIANPLRSLRLAALALQLAVAPAAANAQDLPAAKLAAIERILSSWMSKQGIPGLSVAVALEGQLVWSSAYGLADLENFVPAKTATVYRTCSMGKPMTATAAMLLAEAGKLDLDAPVQRYCPAFPLKAWPLTTRNLLRHMGGIRHYGGPHDLEEQLSTHHYVTVTESLAPFRDDPLLFEPGTDSLYSTYGYDVVGCVVEGAAGKPYLEAMRALVFAPAGMTSIRDDDPAALIPNRAAGYVRADGELRNAPHVDMSNRLPAGGFLTTAADLARFASAFADCKLVSCASRDAMLTAQATRDGGTVDYGLGWGLSAPDDTWLGEREAFHGGSSPGASGMLYLLPKRRLVVVMLTNLESAGERVDTAAAIAKVVAEPVPAAPPPQPPQPLP